MPIRSTFGSIVKERRLQKGLTLSALGVQVGSVKGYLSCIENNKVAPPTSAMVDLLCGALGLDPRKMHWLAFLAKAPAGVRATSEYFALVRKTLRLPDSPKAP